MLVEWDENKHGGAMPEDVIDGLRDEVERLKETVRVTDQQCRDAWTEVRENEAAIKRLRALAEAERNARLLVNLQLVEHSKVEVDRWRGLTGKANDCRQLCIEAGDIEK